MPKLQQIQAEAEQQQSSGKVVFTLNVDTTKLFKLMYHLTRILGLIAEVIITYKIYTNGFKTAN